MTLYYVVKQGWRPGIYKDQKLASAQTRRHPEPEMKVFSNYPDAADYFATRKAKKRKYYYAVASGWKPGVYECDQEAMAEVRGFPGGNMRRFPSRKEAEAYCEAVRKEKKARRKKQASKGIIDVHKPLPYFKRNDGTEAVQEEIPMSHAYVDGSYNAKTGRYGYGALLISEKGVHTVKGSGEGDSFELGPLFGELAATKEAIKLAAELGLGEICILYDCEAIVHMTQERPKEKPYRKKYRTFLDEKREQLSIHFQKVKAHAGILGNEIADTLAKSAAGCHISQGEKEILRRFVV